MKAGGRALVTGASRGIGRAVSLELAARGFDVLATMRDPEAGAELAASGEGRIALATLDVRRPETLALPETLRVVVNNAGLDAEYLPVEHASLEAWRELFETNLFGLLEVTRRTIPALRAAGGGVLCNVTSASLVFPMPFYAAYRASKAAVAALGESLRAELAPFGIRLLEVMPGPVRTDMLAASDRVPEAARWPEYRALAERAHAGRRAVEGQAAAPDAAARRIVEAILDDASPLRVACDPLGESLLAGAGAAEDEARMRSLLAGFGIDLEGA